MTNSDWLSETQDRVAESIFWVRQKQGEQLARSWNDAPEEVVSEHRLMAKAAIEEVGRCLTGE